MVNVLGLMEAYIAHNPIALPYFIIKHDCGESLQACYVPDCSPKEFPVTLKKLTMIFCCPRDYLPWQLNKSDYDVDHYSRLLLHSYDMRLRISKSVFEHDFFPRRDQVAVTPMFLKMEPTFRKSSIAVV